MFFRSSSYYSRQVRLSKLAWSGITLIAISASVFGGWALWSRTAINEPINLPISMTVGHILTPAFRVDSNRFYWIEIVAKKTIPFDTLNCLLGTSSFAEKPCGQSQVIKANWTLSSNGAIAAHGTSEADSGGIWSNDDIARVIGGIQAQSGRDYVLNVDLLEDGTALSSADPHLKIEVPSSYYEDHAFASVFLILICTALALLGGILIGASAIRSRLNSKCINSHRQGSSTT